MSRVILSIATSARSLAGDIVVLFNIYRCRKALALLSVWSSTSFAALVDVGGGLVNDTDLNLCWLKDANYAQTSGFDADGFLDWNTAVSWADSLQFGGYDDWRLPLVSRATSGAVAIAVDCADIGTTQNQCRDNELGYMYYYNLTPGTQTPPTTTGTNLVSSPGPFINLGGIPAPDVANYHSGQEWSTDATLRWSFSFSAGDQGVTAKTSLIQAWAVRDGQCAVSAPGPAPAAKPVPTLPLPALILLAATALGVGLRRLVRH